jgi:hypothetical protein
MIGEAPVADKFWLLLDAACAGTLVEPQAQELAALLDSDSLARSLFVDHMQLRRDIQAMCRAERVFDRTIARIGTTLPPMSLPSSPSPTSTFLSTTLHGSIGFLSSGWPVAYLVATVISGVGLLVGAFTHVSPPTQIVAHSPTVTEDTALPKPRSVFVGRITSMVDCKWSDVSTGVLNGDHVPLGHKYALASGLMEITYETGAKIILQGPATYEVGSGSGGYLSVGKLTAKVESGEWRVESKSPNLQISKSPSSSLSTLHSPLFTIKTPTATVTDLGTEFGVEVNKSGATSAYVFRGAVKVHATAHGGEGIQAVRLTENESIHVERTAGGAAMNRGAVDPAVFVRAERLSALAQEQSNTLRRWQVYSKQLRYDPAVLAYYTFESAGDTDTALPNLSPAGSALDGKIEGATWAQGRLPGKHSLYFHGTGSLDKVILPDQERFKFAGPFSVAVWFRVKRFSAMTHTLVAKGATSWQLHQDKRTKQISFDTSREPFVDPFWDVTRASTKVDDGRWHLAVAVFEPVGAIAHRSMYIDGRLEAEADCPAHVRQNDEAVWLGADSGLSWDEFSGWIDEVAIFSRAMSAGEVALMFEAGDPNGSVTESPEPKKQKGDARQ